MSDNESLNESSDETLNLSSFSSDFSDNELDD